MKIKYVFSKTQDHGVPEFYLWIPGLSKSLVCGTQGNRSPQITTKNSNSSMFGRMASSQISASLCLHLGFWRISGFTLFIKNVKVCKMYYKTTVIKTMWCLFKDSHIDEWNKLVSSEIDPHIFCQFIFDKGSKAIQWGKIIFLTSSTNNWISKWKK